MRPHLASLVDDFRAHASETAVVAHRGVRRYRTTYGEVANLAGRFSAELARRNIVAGERVVLWGTNSAEWVGVFFGCLLRGVIVVPLDAAGSLDFAARVIADTRAKLVVGDEKLTEALKQRAGGDVPPKQSLDGAPDSYDVLALRGIAEHVPSEPLFAVEETVALDSPFQIVFTSGTTAEPRGIVHTHRNVLVTLDPIEREIAKYRRFERRFHPLRFLHSLPLSHVFGQFMGLWCPALLAAEVHFADQLDLSRIADVIQRDRISVLIAVPRVLHLLRAHLLARFPRLAATMEGDEGSAKASGAKAPLQTGAANAGTKVPAYLRSKGKGPGPVKPGGVGTIAKKWWRFRRVHRALGWKFWAIISGGATLPADLEAFYNKLGLALIQGYGMTETAALVTLNHPFHIAPGTIGKPMPGREVKISREGEILVRGAMLSGATWQHGAMHAREGEWLATGDLAEESASGELKFIGRKGDVIVTGAGINIHPADLEAALVAQAGIRSAAVVPCEFAAGTEAVAVVLTGLNDAELDAAVAAANRRLAEFQHIRRVLRWPEPQLPYTSTGKLVRRKVAEWACMKLRSSSASETNPTSLRDVRHPDALLALIAEVTGEPAPKTGDANALRLSEDLHLDSLGRVQLQSAIEQRFAIDIDDDAIAMVKTVGELRRAMGASESASQRVSESAARSPTSQNRDVERPAIDGQSEMRWGSGEGQMRGSLDSARSGERAPLGMTASTTQPSRDENLYPRWPWSWPVRALRVVFIELAMRPLVWALAKPRVVYEPGAREAIERLLADHSANRTTKSVQPLLLIANHITYYDGALVLYALPGPLRRRVAAAMSAEMLLDYRRMRGQGNWLLNLLAPAAYWLLTALFNVFPLPRDRGFRRSFAHAGEAMDRGYSVLIFPEGTRSLAGRMGPFRSGIGLLAEQTEAPIVPIALAGVYELVASRRDGQDSAHSPPRPRWFHAGRIEVRVGMPIAAAKPDAGDPAALASRLEADLRSMVERPLGEGEST